MTVTLILILAIALLGLLAQKPAGYFVVGMALLALVVLFVDR